MSGFVVTRVSDQTFELGEFLEITGEIKERGVDLDPIVRLRDNTRPERLIVAVVGDFFLVPEDQLLTAALNPVAWINSFDE